MASMALAVKTLTVAVMTRIYIRKCKALAGGTFMLCAIKRASQKDYRRKVTRAVGQLYALKRLLRL